MCWAQVGQAPRLLRAGRLGRFGAVGCEGSDSHLGAAVTMIQASSPHKWTIPVKQQLCKIIVQPSSVTGPATPAAQLLVRG